MVLARTTAPLTGRQVARLARRGTSPSISAALDRLVAEGIVHRQQAGRAYLHTLNRAHIAAPIAEQLAGLRAELLRRLRDALADWQPAPVHASLFGSAARADGDRASDIDLLIVRPRGVAEEDSDWSRQVAGLTDAVYAWTGNRAAVVQLDQSEVDNLRTGPPAILADLREDAVDLAGLPVRVLLKARR